MLDASSAPAGLVGENAFDVPPEPIAAGGMAYVYQARDRRLPRDVILKWPRTHGLDGYRLDPSTVGQFAGRLQAEALVLAKLQHPSIVTIHELGQSEEGAPFCVLERVEGKSLREILAEIAEEEEERREPQTRRRIEIVSSLVSIAEALAFAHERGIVHRDVTPNNILMGPRGEATLIDWGLAKDLTLPQTAAMDAAMPLDQEIGDGSSTIIAGTPPYVSLEQALGKPAHPGYDVYSFGATLYHVVAGRPPFSEESAVSYLARLVNGDRPPPAAPRDPELSGIIERAMTLTIEDRFTAAELLRALKEYLTGDLVFSHRYSVSGRAARWVRKHKAVTAGVVAALLIGVLAVLAGSWVRERAERSARLAAEAESRAAAKVAAAEGRAAEEARRTAAAERDRAQALDTAALKEAEARDAQEAAERAGKSSDKYKELQEIANRKRQEADDARETARDLAEAAEKNAEIARKAADQARQDAARAQEEAQETRKEAQASVSAMAREREEAISERQRAQAERDQAQVDRRRAEQEREAALAERQAAERERDDLRERVRLLEEQLRNQPKPPPDKPQQDAGLGLE